MQLKCVGFSGHICDILRCINRFVRHKCIADCSVKLVGQSRVECVMQTHFGNECIQSDTGKAYRNLILKKEIKYNSKLTSRHMANRSIVKGDFFYMRQRRLNRKVHHILDGDVFSYMHYGFLSGEQQL